MQIWNINVWWLNISNGNWSVTVNGKTYNWNNISIVNNQVFIDWKIAWDDKKNLIVKIEIKWEVSIIKSDANIEVNWNVNWYIEAKWSVQCWNIGKHVDAWWSVNCLNVNWNADAWWSMNCWKVSWNADAWWSMIHW